MNPHIQILAILGTCLTLTILPGCSISKPRPISVQEAESLATLKREFHQVDIRRISHVSQRMALSGPNADAFWNIYRDYLERLAEIRARQLRVLLDYADDLNQGVLPEARAHQSLDESLRFEKERLSAREQLLTDVTPLLSGQQKLRLYQIEQIIDAELRGALLAQVPLAE